MRVRKKSARPKKKKMPCLAKDCPEPVAERGACVEHRAMFDRVKDEMKKPDKKAGVKVHKIVPSPRKAAPPNTPALIARAVWTAGPTTGPKLAEKLGISYRSFGRHAKKAVEAGWVVSKHRVGFAPGPVEPPAADA